MSDDQTSFPFILWFSIKWILANLLAWSLSGLIVYQLFEVSQITILIGFLIVLLPTFQWVVLRTYGDWALSWVLASLATMIILAATIGSAIFLSLMCLPAMCFVIVIVTAGFGAANLFVSNYLPEFPAWIHSPLIDGIFAMVLSAVVFVLTYDNYGLIISAIISGLFYGLPIPLGFLINWIDSLLDKSNK